jgi:hypothetical protein
MTGEETVGNAVDSQKGTVGEAKEKKKATKREKIRIENCQERV